MMKGGKAILESMVAAMPMMIGIAFFCMCWLG